MVGHDWNSERGPAAVQGFVRVVRFQTAEMLWGAAGKLVGIGSALPSERALARWYMSLLVAPCASIAAATTAQFRISVDIEDVKSTQLMSL